MDRGRVYGRVQLGASKRPREFIAECRTRVVKDGIDGAATGEWVARAEQSADSNDPFVEGYLEDSLQRK
jgi:hypothetical protein